MSQARRAALILIGAVAAMTLAGCTPQAQSAASSHSSRPSSSATHRPTPTHTSDRPTTSPAPSASTPPDPPSGTGSDPAAAKALAVKACQAIAGGFAAASVAQARPLAQEAAQRDPIWIPLADDLAYIEKNPIDPNTGEGPQKTIDDSATAAHDCFHLAGVQVSQD